MPSVRYIPTRRARLRINSVNYHNRENLPQNGSICVANHTTVIDTVTLSNDRPYALIGQSHGGLLGWFQRRLARCTKVTFKITNPTIKFVFQHVWFERSELRDRKAVGRRLMEHTKDTRNYPCLIFPEGTCINNTSVMQFKKGSFEASDTIYPGKYFQNCVSTLVTNFILKHSHETAFFENVPQWRSNTIHGLVMHFTILQNSEWQFIC